MSLQSIEKDIRQAAAAVVAGVADTGHVLAHSGNAETQMEFVKLLTKSGLTRGYSIYLLGWTTEENYKPDPVPVMRFRYRFVGVEGFQARIISDGISSYDWFVSKVFEINAALLLDNHLGQGQNVDHQGIQMEDDITLVKDVDKNDKIAHFLDARFYVDADIFVLP